jgi:ribose transport system substrate-binding protein
MKKILLIAVLVIVIAGMAFAGPGQQSGGKIKAEFIAMDSIDEHWLAVKKGTEDKAKELGSIDLSFNAPPGKVDAQVQANMVDDAITKKVQILLIAPLDANSLAPAVERAKKAGLTVIFIDTKANTQQFDGVIWTNNGAAARLAANEMGKVTGGKGKIAIINAQPGASTTMLRENEFKDEIAKKYPGITIVGTQYCNGEAQLALNQATDFMTANPDLVGIYACNEGSSVGTANAIAQAGKAGRVNCIAFDWSANIKDLINKGVIQATMKQNPYVMGYEGLQMGVDALQKKAIKNDVDSGVTVVSKDNIATIQ